MFLVLTSLVLAVKIFKIDIYLKLLMYFIKKI